MGDLTRVMGKPSAYKMGPWPMAKGLDFFQGVLIVALLSSRYYSILHPRPQDSESTASRPICAVNQSAAQLVPRWGTTRESWVLWFLLQILLESCSRSVDFYQEIYLTWVATLSKSRFKGLSLHKITGLWLVYQTGAIYCLKLLRLVAVSYGKVKYVDSEWTWLESIKCGQCKFTCTFDSTF